MKHIALGAAGLLAALALNAQQAKTEWNDPGIGSIGKAVPRS